MDTCRGGQQLVQRTPQSCPHGLTPLTPPPFKSLPNPNDCVQQDPEGCGFHISPGGQQHSESSPLYQRPAPSEATT